MQVLVELAIERDQDIPALIYEGRPTVKILLDSHKAELSHHTAACVQGPTLRNYQQAMSQRCTSMFAETA